MNKDTFNKFDKLSAGLKEAALSDIISSAGLGDSFDRIVDALSVVDTPTKNDNQCCGGCNGD